MPPLLSTLLLMIPFTLAPPGHAGPAAVQRTPLLDTPLAAPKNVARVQIQRITLGPGVHPGLHLHPVPVFGTVEQGQILFQLEGQPEQRLHAGDVFHEPANVRVARFDNASDTASVTFTALYLLGPDDHETLRILHR